MASSEPTVNITINIDKNGTTTLATAGCICKRDIDINVDVPTTGGGDEDIPESAFVVEGSASYRFAGGYWDWFLEKYKDRMTTNNLGTTIYMFNVCGLEDFPFETLNYKDGGDNIQYTFSYADFKKIPSIDFKQTDVYKDCSYLFNCCYELEEIGTLKNLYPSTISSMFKNCRKLRYLPEFENLNMSRVNSYMYASVANLFDGCYSIREIPEDFLKEIWGIWNSGYSSTFSTTFASCYVLDEIRGLNPKTGIMTSNMFNTTFSQCGRVKNIIFLTDNGTPYNAEWKGQVLDLSLSLGWNSNVDSVIDYNSGITADKEVKDDATYQALKNDPDWFTTNVAYSRYNHDSAVNTINSLPDTSAYLATAGGTNIIKFKGAAGSKTDGGAINTLTEEEIAVATAKGWTVQFV